MNPQSVHRAKINLNILSADCLIDASALAMAEGLTPYPFIC